MADGDQPAERHVSERVEWRVKVRAAFGPQAKQLDLIVAVPELSVVVAPPTGVAFVVPRESIERLCDALRAADSVAEHRKKILEMDKP